MAACLQDKQLTLLEAQQAQEKYTLVKVVQKVW
jgi:hypothetical protein